MIVRKKPIKVEAFQLTENNAGMLADWCNGLLVNGNIQIMTLEGVKTARQNDYIIRGIAGEFFSCSPVVFEMNYEVISK
jgi:hypothetical protein